MNQVYLYEEVPTWAVPPESIKAANNMLNFCIADLQISGVNIRWFNEYSDSDPENGRLFSEKTTFKNHEQIRGCVFLQYGAANERAIWLNFELDPATIPRTVAHEARHIYQAVHRGTLAKYGKEAARELDAIRYAHEALDAYQYYRTCPAYAFNRTTKIIKTI